LRALSDGDAVDHEKLAALDATMQEENEPKRRI
jgi:hypothetical protein